MGQSEAREALQRARVQLERAQEACWDPDDAEVAATWAFYAYENAVVAVAESIGVKWKKNHVEKANLAATLAKDGVVDADVSDRLLELNDLRKDVAYGDPGPELEKLDLEDLSRELEEFIWEVDAVVEREIEE